MSKRLQVVMDDAEYDEIQGAADGARLTVSAWVRHVLRAARSAPGTADGPTPPTGVGSPAGADTTRGLPPGGHEPGGTAGPHVPDPALVRAVMDRHGFSSPAEALDYALRRAAEPPLGRSDLLALRGIGWAGDLGDLRAGSLRPVEGETE